jgi:hypothetical protein
MQNRNIILAASALFGSLALFTPANAEGNISGVDDADMTQFMAYLTRMNRPSHTYAGELALGMELPAQGMTFYDIPAEFKATRYRYTVVNNRPVVIDPTTRKVIWMMPR